jgi:hypothetical protein
MADQKVSQLPLLTSPASEDLVLIIDNPNGTPSSKSITLKILFGNIPANTSIVGTLDVSGNSTFSQVKITGDAITVQASRTPANSTISIAKGTIFWDSSYIYVATANNVVKRASLQSF